MMNDYARSFRRPRRKRWQRDPRVVLAGALVAVAGSVMLGGDVYGALNVGQPAHFRVHPGDTLWTIAASHYSSGDVRNHVDDIISLNHLSGSSITPGEDLLLPAS